MNALTLLVLIGLLWGVKELALGTILWYQRRKIRHSLQMEVTESHFARARNELMRLALIGEVDVNSESFKRFYFFNTAMMRRPDQYRRFSHAFTLTFLSEQGTDVDDVLLRESKSWTPAFKEVVKASAHAMDYLILDYSWLVRCMFWMEKRHNPDSSPYHMLKRMAKRLEAKEQPIAEIRRTQNAMYAMAGGTPMTVGAA